LLTQIVLCVILIYLKHGYFEIMNNRINELAIKAGGIWQGGYVDNHAGDGVWTEQKFVHGGDMDVEQFARLLVQECAIIANRADNTETEIRCMYDVITEHFGVEK
jgi:hypothetical protein